MHSKVIPISTTSTSTNRCFKFREIARTDIGMQRQENQDAFGIVHSANTSLFVVADGMGGARGGAMAAAIAVNMVSNTAIETGGALSPHSLLSAINRTNEVIHYQSRMNEDLSGMGTTVVALAFIEQRAVIAHVGDSRIYRLRGGEIQQLTNDHTIVQELVDSGIITPEEAESHPTAHMLTQSLGPTPSVEVAIEVLAGPVESGDKFLLCSDGLHGFNSSKRTSRTLKLNATTGSCRIANWSRSRTWWQ